MASRISFTLFFFVFCSTFANNEFAIKCTQFKSSIKSTSIQLISTKYYLQGSLVDVSNPAYSLKTTKLPSFCQIKIKVKTFPDSNVNTEFWFPDEWNRRFITFGNGGYSGGIAYSELGTGIKRGFASMSCDLGHSSTKTNSLWALLGIDGNGKYRDELIHDFSYRAITQSAKMANKLLNQYYMKLPNKKYFSGCSTGGRQGLNFAERYPNLFDGIIIGSPVSNIANLQSYGMDLSKNVLPFSRQEYIHKNQWKYLHNQVLEQCDKLDGLMDGIISDPFKCLEIFSYDKIKCLKGKPKFNSSCLNENQIKSLHKIGSNLTLPESSEFLFGSILPGSENAVQNGYVGPRSNPFALGYFQNFIYNDSSWNYKNFSNQSIIFAKNLDVGKMNLWNFYNLSNFSNRGGKLIHYVGLADYLIPPYGSTYFYEKVKEAMGKEINSFYRLFTIAGMNHCQMGPGAWAFGGVEQESLGFPPLKEDSLHNVLWGIVNWIENGTIPEKFIGVKYVNDMMKKGIEFTRPICPWPKLSRYISGDVKSANSFDCI